MAKRKQRAARIASAALLSTTVFASPPAAERKKPTQVVNQPNPVVDAGTEPSRDSAPRPVIINQVSPQQTQPSPRLTTDAGVSPKK